MATAPMEGLEATFLPQSGGPVPAAPIPELEMTRLPPAGAVAVAPVEALEAFTRFDQPVPSEQVPELELGRYQDLEPRVAQPGAGAGVTCRYCKTVQATALLCARCGMRLPAVAPATQAAREPAPDADICRACGSRVVGGRCGECGAAAG